MELSDAINNSGQIVGSYYLTSRGAGLFLYSNGKMTTLPVPADASAVSAIAIDDNGEIAGALYPRSGGAAHAARYANGVWSDLGTIAGAASNVGMAINLSSQVVGTAIFPQTQYHPPTPGKHVEHRTASDEEAEVLIFEPAATKNTGNVEDPFYTAPNGIGV